MDYEMHPISEFQARSNVKRLHVRTGEIQYYGDPQTATCTLKPAARASPAVVTACILCSGRGVCVCVCVCVCEQACAGEKDRGREKSTEHKGLQQARVSRRIQLPEDQSHPSVTTEKTAQKWDADWLLLGSVSWKGGKENGKNNMLLTFPSSQKWTQK